MNTTDFNHLPIADFLPAINQELQHHNRLILQAEPGAGKSTAVPWYLLQHLNLQDKTIVMLEPRRIAASSLAKYLASVLNEQVGETVGYQIKNERRISSKTRLEIVTEGVLTARMQQDPELSGVGLVIFDEFHERSLHADLGLALCKEIMQVYNESLKVLVMSATLDSELLSEFLEHAPVITCPGRCYPVAVEYLSQPITSVQFWDWRKPMLQLILKARQQAQGDVLVFLPGQNEINRLAEDINEYLTHQVANTQVADKEQEVASKSSNMAHSYPSKNQPSVVVPLYGQLNYQQQQAALRVDERGRQKIILATNIAETSLTLPNIGAVVDSGLVRNSLYDVTSGMTRLTTQRISKASAEQRTGRAGRLQAGHGYRLWTQSQQQSMPDFLPEAMLQSDLTQLRLSLAQWGIKQRDEMHWLTPPPQAHYAAATELLKSLDFLDKDLNPTKQTEQAAQFNLEPRLVRCLMAAKQHSHRLQALACDLVAVLSESHFYHAREDADLTSRLQALNAYRENKAKALKSYPIKASVIEQVAKSAAIYRQKMGIERQQKSSTQNVITGKKNQAFDEPNDEPIDEANMVGKLLSLAYPDRIAKRRSADFEPIAQYLMSNGKTAILKQGNRLKASDWLVIADLDGQRQDGQIYLAVTVTQNDLQQSIGFKTSPRYFYNAQKNKLEGQEVTALGAIVLQQTVLKEPNKEAMQACLFEAIKQTKLSLLPWSKKVNKWLAKVRWLLEVDKKGSEGKYQQNTAEWPDFSQQGLIDSLNTWLFPYLSQAYQVKDLANIDLLALLQNQLDYASQQAIHQQAPDYYQAPNGKQVAIRYETGQLPKVSLPLQALFGELTSPKLAWGQVSLSFELLSPANRPIQTTSDLAGFWQTSYFEIAKEMRGRYPKHRWPEEPLLEKPGRSIKKK